MGLGRSVDLGMYCVAVCGLKAGGADLFGFLDEESEGGYLKIERKRVRAHKSLAR